MNIDWHYIAAAILGFTAFSQIFGLIKDIRSEPKKIRRDFWYDIILLIANFSASFGMIDSRFIYHTAERSIDDYSLIALCTITAIRHSLFAKRRFYAYREAIIIDVMES